MRLGARRQQNRTDYPARSGTEGLITFQVPSAEPRSKVEFTVPGTPAV